jgi:predicted DNA-binding transcriptional regulator YafY
MYGWTVQQGVRDIGARTLKASRIVHLMLLLQREGILSARELAEELGVSVRTIHRDIDALAEAGVPVYAERGSRGGIRLVDGYRTRLTGLTPEEAGSLFLAELPGPAGELGLGEVVAVARLKMLAALPDHLHAHADRLRRHFLLDTGTWFKRPDDVPWLTSLAGAVWNQRCVRITYRRWGRSGTIVERTLEPLGLVLQAGTWYLIVLNAAVPRMYRVSSILDLHVLDETFDVPEEFDLEESWRRCSREFEERLYTAQMTVRMSPEGIARRHVFLLPFQVDAIDSQLKDPDPGEWTRLTVPVESMDHAVVDVLKLAPFVEVIAPAELRDRLRETVARLAEMHAPGGEEG